MPKLLRSRAKAREVVTKRAARAAGGGRDRAAARPRGGRDRAAGATARRRARPRGGATARRRARRRGGAAARSPRRRRAHRAERSRGGVGGIQRGRATAAASVPTRASSESVSTGRHDSAMTLEEEKLEAARYAAGLVEPGARVGLGTGTTVAHLLPALPERDLALRCVAPSPATEELARSAGLPVESFDALEELDVAIDGADQIAPDGWLTKGGGRAHTREKLVAAAARRFVVIGAGDKVVDVLSAPVALELFRFGLAGTLRRLGEARVREGPPSPDGGVIADWWGEVADPGELARKLEAEPGVAGHGLFPPSLVSDVVIARGGKIEHRRL